MEQMYKIKESELKMFHMAAILQTGENNEAQEIVDEIRNRKILEDVEAQNSTSNNTQSVPRCKHKWSKRGKFTTIKRCTICGATD